MLHGFNQGIASAIEPGAGGWNFKTAFAQFALLLGDGDATTMIIYDII